MTTTLAAPRLSLQTLTIAEETVTIRSLDWDRDRFDIEFGLQNGTTYNSYLIWGDKIALVDTSHAKFRSLYLEELQRQVDLSRLDYLIISHTEPDHSGLVKDVLQLAPQVTVVGTKVALQFLQDLVHIDFKQQAVKNGDQLDLGKGHLLQFVNAPNLHWPDTMMTYDHKTGVLFTCDIFGMHYCDSSVFDENLPAILPDYRFYYECLMAPNARSVLSAMKRMDELPPVQIVANGHGPLLKYNLKELTENYRTWSQAQTKHDTNVVIFYVSDYGYSDRLSQAIARGVGKTGVALEMRDLRTTDLQEIRELVEHASGVVFTTPPQSLPSVQTAVATILGSLQPKQAVGIYESFGGDEEAIDLVANRCKDLGIVLGFPLLRIKATPSQTTYQMCEEAGTDLGQLLTRKQNIQQIKALDSDLDRAMGRIAGGLYIVTAKKGEMTSAMVASWVSQASFKPLGITVAVAKDRAIEALMQVGDHFVLNILEEGNYSHLLRHFLKRFAPGADRFAGVKTQPSAKGIPILTEALAYVECQVVSRMDAHDHWVVYAVAEDGKVSKPDALTAAHHRKVGNHY
ncbi:MAG: diflavin flavoprotein [Pseudanabaenaceae cyanobacterium SKYGB_i_bin29]|nr:diflavin flavoprotein [Pseudanabaenaceae cyanobacterium SKYG29]MDW8422532.1 diflavin flavoprotein [Pseudanabaenaceae cyanobacterium SKYGB_i_bin29]